MSSILRADPSVTAHVFDEPDGLCAEGHAAIEIVVSDTGYVIPPEKPAAATSTTPRIHFQPLQSQIQKCHHLRILIVEVRPISCTFGRL